MTPEAPERESAPEAPHPASVDYNVETLASLVERRGSEFPDRVEEWHWYLVSLREVATTSGSLPVSVRLLVHDVFEPLLAS
jgi:hypothetical protein